MPIQIQNARILTPFSQQDGAVLVTGDRILDVSRSNDAPKGTKVIDAKNLYLVPGYVDLRMHTGTDNAKAVANAVNIHAMEGTTTLLPTVETGAPADMARAIDSIRAAEKAASMATIAGVHLQGPFISPKYMPKETHPHLLVPGESDWKPLLDKWPDGLKMVGISPELPGALAMADSLREREIVASISHSTASYDQVLTAVTHGFSDVTNIFRKCSSLIDSEEAKAPGVTESALIMDELTVQLVADGRRLPLTSLQIAFRCKGAENILLVTDAEPPTDDTSDLPTMALLVRNMVAAGISLRVALRMATVNPARRIGLDRTKGRIGPGYDADLLLLDEAMNVIFCMARGKILRNNLDQIN